MNSFEGLTTFECKRCNRFSIDSSLTTAEQEQQMQAHLNGVHPYWEFENLGDSVQDVKENFRRVSAEGSRHFCAACGTILTSQTTVCPNCAATRSRFVEIDAERKRSGRSGHNRKQTFGLLGSVLLFFGVFTPIISVPIVGSVNYFQNGKGDGVIVLIFALISFALVLAKKYAGLWITGVGSLALIVFTLVNFHIRMSQIQDDMESKLAGNPFRGIADVAMQSVQLQWGWAILAIGAALLIASAALSNKSH